jgi:hypothetical protein
MSKKQAAAAEKPKRAELEQYLQMEEQRRNLSREADALERAAKPLKEKFKAYAEAEGGKARRVEVCGHVLAIVTKNGQVKWKDEFSRVAGPIETARIAAAPPQVDSLTVEKA